MIPCIKEDVSNDHIKNKNYSNLAYIIVDDKTKTMIKFIDNLSENFQVYFLHSDT